MALTPEQEALNFNPELQGVSRQQKLAELLMAKSAQGQPQGQMISGYYVAPSWSQQLNPMANMLAGQAVEDRADAKQIQLAQALKQQRIAEAKNIMNAPDNEQRVLTALGGNTNLSSGLASKLLENYTKEPNWEKTEVNLGGQVIKGVYDKRNPDVMATFRPYNATEDVPRAEAVYRGVLPAGNQNVPLSVRNNNPGNLVAPNGQFQQFPTSKTGNAALINDLTLKVSGQSPAYKSRFGDALVTPAKLAEVWSPANAKGNTPASTTNYGNFIAQKLGIDADAPIPNNPQTIAKVGQAIAEFEKGDYEKPSQLASKYELEIPKSFASPQKRDEWLAKSQEPLTGEPAKKADGAVTTLNALDNYKKLIDTYSKAQVLMPDDRAKLSEAHAQLMLQLKDANGLGVLNKGDLPMLEKLIVNPTNIDSLLISKNVLESQIGNQKAFMRDVAANSYLNNYKEIPPRIKQTLLNVDSDVEKATAQKDVQKATQLSKPVVYNSQSAAEAAGKSGTLKDGQTIVIGNKRFTWRND